MKTSCVVTLMAVDPDRLLRRLDGPVRPATIYVRVGWSAFQIKPLGHPRGSVCLSKVVDTEPRG